LSNGVQLVRWRPAARRRRSRLAGVASTSKRDFGVMGNFLTVARNRDHARRGGEHLFPEPGGYLALLGSVHHLQLAPDPVADQQIVRGGETNYVSATLSLYVLGVQPLHELAPALGIFGGNRD